MKIVLLGYMASGKTYIANKLSDYLNKKHLDLDAYIVAKENASISEIFKNKGEIYFRKIESKYLKEILLLEESFVLSVGGGTPCYANNMELILENSISVYLKANVETLYMRLITEKKQRPIVALFNEDDLKEFIAKHLFERNPFYNQAIYKVTIDDQAYVEIVNKIIQKIDLR